MHGLIGPNGAGKTTLLNVLSGFYRPTRGAITLGSRDVGGLAPYRIARAGVARTFQTTQLFGAMSVVENVEVGLAGGDAGRLLAALAGLPAVARDEARLRAEAEALLRFVGYKGDPDELSANLPFGVKRLVEIARALARRPAALLLDEPAAGLSHEEIGALAELIARVRASGTAVLLVGHHMDLVMGVSDRVTVLNYGRKIADGPPSAIQRDPLVIEAYLGAVSGGGGGPDGESPPDIRSRLGEDRRAEIPRPAPREALLDVHGLGVAYGRMAVVHDVEQMAESALEIADRAYVLEQGRIVLNGNADALRRDERVARAYLGAGTT